MSDPFKPSVGGCGHLTNRILAHPAWAARFPSRCGHCVPGNTIEAASYESVPANQTNPCPGERMPDQPSQPQSDRFKAEMPQIPGVAPSSPKRAGFGGPALVIAGSLFVLVAVFVGARLLKRPRQQEAAGSSAQIDVPAPAPDLSPALPVAVDPNPVIARVGELAKPWDSRLFTFHNSLSGENVPAILIRMPGGSPAHASGYWSFAMRAAFGNCRLEFVQDLQKLATDYSYSAANHPMVGNPCSRTLFDPLKYAQLPGNVLSRGAIVQGSDLRPPLAIEIRIQGKDIIATRME